jgi:hypothetical protein
MKSCEVSLQNWHLQRMTFHNRSNERDVFSRFLLCFIHSLLHDKFDSESNCYHFTFVIISDILV